VIESVSVDSQVVATCDACQPLAGTAQPLLLTPGGTPVPLKVPAGHQQVSFSFTAPSFAATQSGMFKYRLEGLDHAWVEAGMQRVAYYTHIPPGDYRFHVIACNSDGIWNEEGASVALTAEPHVWQTAWFRGAALFAGAGLLSAGVFLRVRRRYRWKLEALEQRQALDRERARIAQDLHDDLGAGLVEISLGSALAQDKALSREEAREHALEIGTRARELVAALDEIVWAVNPRHDSVGSLATYFCQYAQHFLKTTTLRCHLDIAKDLPAAPLTAEQRHSLFLAFKEALSNAVQHAGASDLRLAISAPNGMLTVALSDNGRGFDLTARPEHSGADGLANMRSRLRQLQGECQLTSLHGQGTTVTLRVPLLTPGASRPSYPK